MGGTLFYLGCIVPRVFNLYKLQYVKADIKVLIFEKPFDKKFFDKKLVDNLNDENIQGPQDLVLATAMCHLYLKVFLKPQNSFNLHLNLTYTTST